MSNNTSKYIVTRSNYTVKRKRKSLSNGDTIYERDYMGTTNLGGFSSAAFPNIQSNFKMVYNNNKELVRKHNYGEWIKNQNGNSIWTSQDILSLPNYKSNKEIVIKPNYNSLLDFAYFGSCTDLIKVSINDIIEKFPAELYVTDTACGIAQDGIFEGKMVYKVDNPFKIDIISKTLPKNGETKNNIRYFCEAANKYDILDKNEVHVGCVNLWERFPSDTPLHCIAEGHIGGHAKICVMNEEIFIIAQYRLNGEIILVTTKDYQGLHIRPCEACFNDFYDNLEDIEQMMLSLDRTPKYTMYLDTPRETEDGFLSAKEYYTWPTKNGWNLDIESYEYENYISKLLELTLFYDEYYCNNMWRMLTHDSIKNLDKTYVNENKDETQDDIAIGVGKMEGFILSISKIFDDLKRYIDAIKTVSNITYNENNNTPDYLLSDELENKGWEVYSPTNGLDENASVKIIIDGISREYDINSSNICFLRNLLLNSKGILKKKGTKCSIEEVLGLFGLVSYDNIKNSTFKYTWANGSSDNFYDIPKDGEGKRVYYTKELIKGAELKKYYDYKLSEYVNIARFKDDANLVGPILMDQELEAENYNLIKKNNNGDNYEPLRGLPVKYVSFESNNGEIYKYLVPWFDNITELDGKPYFQMYGGWGKRNTLKIRNTANVYNTDTIKSNEQFTIYSETQKYIPIVGTIDDLRKVDSNDLNDNDIFYVLDVSNINSFYPNTENGDIEVSHYFIIENKNHSYGFAYGISPNANIVCKDGWKNIPQSDISNCVNDGLRVAYLEEIIDENRGNNPHIGYGQYDEGKYYIEQFSSIFKYSLENDNFTDDALDCETGEYKSVIREIGYDVIEKMDSAKIWFFSDKLKNKRLYSLEKTYSTGMSEGVTYVANVAYRTNDTFEYTSVGKYATINKESLYDSEMIPYNVEEEKIYKGENTESNYNDEAAAFSVINNKHFKISFNGKITRDTHFMDFLDKSILPYVLQVIPSTTLLEIEIDTDELTAVENKDKIALVAGMAEDNHSQYEYKKSKKKDNPTWTEMTYIPFPNESAPRFLHIIEGGQKGYYKLVKITKK